MKVGDLIDYLAQFPQDMEVCIFDVNKNEKHASEEPTGEGVYPEIRVYQIMSEEELAELQKENDKARNWIALEFDSGEEEQQEQQKVQVIVQVDGKNVIYLYDEDITRMVRRTYSNEFADHQIHGKLFDPKNLNVILKSPPLKVDEAHKLET